ncbi:MAG: sel1 repeat family protein [Lentisphaerae bacterium]|jgi:hypothetical protein|nr:sel1 repeat family protein [Lentisphaerota bacterium]MBT7059702.1 sel1 repeat family protein [Lentisphaerota bacterium]
MSAKNIGLIIVTVIVTALYCHRRNEAPASADPAEGPGNDSPSATVAAQAGNESAQDKDAKREEAADQPQKKAAPERVPVYVLRNRVTGGMLCTIKTDEVDSAPTSAQWQLRGSLWEAFPEQREGAVPIFRLHSSGKHLFTADPDERDRACQTLGWEYEGVAFYAHVTEQPGTIPLHRFCHRKRIVHRFVSSENARLKLHQDAAWSPEGIAFWVYPLSEENSHAVKARLARLRANLPMEVAKLRKRAVEGEAEAQHLLGDAYYFGRGTKRSLRHAHHWWYKAARQGNQQCLHNLGSAFERGEGVSKDLAVATQYYSVAADSGFAPSDVAYGRLIKLGYGFDPVPLHPPGEPLPTVVNGKADGTGLRVKRGAPLMKGKKVLRRLAEDAFLREWRVVKGWYEISVPYGGGGYAMLVGLVSPQWVSVVRVPDNSGYEEWQRKKREKEEAEADDRRVIIGAGREIMRQYSE